mmetsp:Transcript_6020/g.13180  ORF Transcript_6020/g.13180 Transcript_6020/m.13180 type:complete len:101 (+) Transcript_6020:1126-1428(+)
MDCDVAAAGEKFINDTYRICDEKELKGLGDCHYEFQPSVMPTMQSLVGDQIDFYSQYDLTQPDGSVQTQLRWCQGRVLYVSNGKIYVCLVLDCITSLSKQ